MSEISGFNASARISALLEANRVTGPDVKTVPSAVPKTSTFQSYQLPPPRPFRLASDPGPATFSVDLVALGGDADEIRSALAGQLEKIFEVFQGRGKSDSAVGQALSSASDLIDAAASGKSDAPLSFQIRLANVTRLFGDGKDGDPATGGVSAFAVEIGLARSGRVDAQEVRVTGVGGEAIDLTAEQRQTGVSGGVYRIQDEALSSPELEAARGADKAQVEAIQLAFDRLRLVRDALASYRHGDTRALEEVERFFRSGTLDAGAVRAISDVRGTSETVIPGSGVIGL